MAITQIDHYIKKNDTYARLLVWQAFERLECGCYDRKNNAVLYMKGIEHALSHMQASSKVQAMLTEICENFIENF